MSPVLTARTMVADSRAFVLGSGSWGTALALVLADAGRDVVLWTRDPHVAGSMQLKRINERYLSGVMLPASIACTHKMEMAQQCDVVVLAVPCQFLRPALRALAPNLSNAAHIVSAIKGIELATSFCVSDIVRQEVLDVHRPLCRYSVLSGPSFAREVAEKKPTAVTIASETMSRVSFLQDYFNTSYFRLYSSLDIIGVEVAGALKNVIAIAAGICDGMRFGNNTRAALVTRGLAEISRLGVKMGANPLTFSGLSGIGDLVLTCTGGLSRNRHVGEQLGRGKQLQQIVAAMDMVAEGVATTKSALTLSTRHTVDMPILREVYDVLYRDKPCKDAVRSLMSRSQKEEIYF